MNKPKTLGIAFGGGGARGMVHIGILQVLEEAGIIPNYIAGTSMGAIISAAYALGNDTTQIQNKMLEFSKEKLIRLRNFNIFNESLVRADSIERALETVFNDKTFDDCVIPFRTCATDIESGKLHILEKGFLKTALRATSAIPMILPPVFYEGKVLVDGALITNVPLELLNDFKPDVTLGIRVQQFSSRQNIAATIFEHYYAPHYKHFLGRINFIKRIRSNMKLITDIILRSLEIATSGSTSERIAKNKPDLLITPTLEIGTMEFNRMNEAIEAGRQAMKQHLPKLLKLLNMDIPKKTKRMIKCIEMENTFEDSD